MKTLSAVLLLCLASGFSEEPAPQPEKKKDEAPVMAASGNAASRKIRVSSDDGMVMDDANKAISFKGNVELVQEDLTLLSDELTIHYDVVEGKRDFVSIEAVGHVRCNREKDELKIESETMFHDRKKEDFVFKSENGVSKVTQKGNMIEGKDIFYNVKNGNLRVVGRSVITLPLAE